MSPLSHEATLAGHAPADGQSLNGRATGFVALSASKCPLFGLARAFHLREEPFGAVRDVHDRDRGRDQIDAVEGRWMLGAVVVTSTEVGRSAQTAPLE